MYNKLKHVAPQYLIDEINRLLAVEKGNQDQQARNPRPRNPKQTRGVGNQDQQARNPSGNPPATG